MVNSTNTILSEIKRIADLVSVGLIVLLHHPVFHYRPCLLSYHGFKIISGSTFFHCNERRSSREKYKLLNHREYSRLLSG